MATLVMAMRQRRIITDLKKARAVNDGVWYPQIGDHVTLVGSGWGEWVVLSTAGQICAADDLPSADKKGGFRRIVYGSVVGGATWVVQRVRDTNRNPVWVEPELNRHGEGEHEQRHVVVTRTASGEYAFWPYFDADDEIAAIERASGHAIADIYRCSNRHNGRLSGAFNSSTSTTVAVGYIACVSDYLYFGDAGCLIREECVAMQHVGDAALVPVYTRDFARYASTVPLPLVDATTSLVPVAADDLTDRPPAMVGTLVSMDVAVQRSTDAHTHMRTLVSRLPLLSNVDAVHLLSSSGYKCWVEYMAELARTGTALL